SSLLLTMTIHHEYLASSQPLKPPTHRPTTSLIEFLFRAAVSCL
ncbi:16863_t:CDS:1, partial [Racocetra persica]